MRQEIQNRHRVTCVQNLVGQPKYLSLISTLPVLGYYKPLPFSFNCLLICIPNYHQIDYHLLMHRWSKIQKARISPSQCEPPKNLCLGILLPLLSLAKELSLLFLVKSYLYLMIPLHGCAPSATPPHLYFQPLSPHWVISLG